MKPASGLTDEELDALIGVPLLRLRLGVMRRYGKTWEAVLRMTPGELAWAQACMDAAEQAGTV
jgi:hypothetical protein